MEISVKRLMTLERILLEMDATIKFKLELSEAFKLYGYLRDVARMTNFVFSIQEEYAKRENPTQDEMKAYHDKVMDSTLEYDYETITRFIDEVDGKCGDERLREVVSKLRFW